MYDESKSYGKTSHNFSYYLYEQNTKEKNEEDPESPDIKNTSEDPPIPRARKIRW